MDMNQINELLDGVKAFPDSAEEIYHRTSKETIHSNIGYLANRLSNDVNVICDNDLKLKHQMALADYVMAASIG